jgi:pimeloyl-ACP methyl ester carboxylesterase
MTELYFIPGLGADARLYTKQKQAGFTFRVLEWIKPYENESLQEYSARLSEGIRDKSNFALVGVSLGGLVAQEIARLHRPKKLIIISSAKCSKEIPFYLRLFRIVPLHRLFSGSAFRAMGKMARRILGGTNKEEGKQVQAMIDAADPDFMKWAIHQVIHWDCKAAIENTVHLHGTHDIMFPACWIKNAVFVKGGSHIMIYTSAGEVNKLIRNELYGMDVQVHPD